MMPSNPSSSGKAFDKTLDISVTILKRLEEVSGLSPFPYLKQAASSALVIVEAVKEARDNKEAFRELAKETCQLVDEVIGIYPEDGALSQKLREDLDALLVTLAKIKKYTTKQAKKSTIVRFFSCLLTSNSGADKIAECRNDLERAFQRFGFQSNVAIREDTAAIKADTHEILQELKQQGDPSTPPAPPPPPTSNIVTNTNSGNTTTTTLNNSNNDFSVRAPGAPKNRRKPVTVPKPPPVPPVFVAPMVIDPMANAFTGRAGRANYFGSNITTNTNSGNTTTTTITNSGNDYSSRTYGGHRSFHSPPPSPRSPNFYRGNSMSSR